MKRRHIIAIVAAATFLGVTGVSAQVTGNDDITVTARNVGLFEFTITEASFDFGDVDSSGAVLAGTGAGVTGNGRNGGDTGGTYTASSAASWTCRSAPSRTVTLINDSSVVAGPLAGDRLEMQVPATAGGTSQGYKRFSTDSGLLLGELITGMTAGNGANAASGNLDFRLTVLDSDAAGATTWTVVITASGT